MAAYDKIANYLQYLVDNKNKLADNLIASGQNVTADSPLDTLVDAVVLVHNDIQYGTWTPTADGTSFKSPGIPFLPARIAMSCTGVVDDGKTLEGGAYISLLNIEIEPYGSEVVSQASATTLTTDTTATIAVSVNRDESGVYYITLNSSSTNYKFAGNYNYMWVASARSWDQI